MRLPMNGEEVDYAQTTKMIDVFMESGFNYFDTAHGYIGGKSEIALRECLVKRYNRDEYILVNKLTDCYFKAQADIVPFFEQQLKWCGVDYFDFYLMHAQNAENFKHYKKNKAYETAFELKKQGKIKHIGISFHDKADVLEDILKVCDIFKAQALIPCTDCKYCVEGCPMNIKIPEIFADLNATKKYENCDSRWYYMIHTQDGGKASDCIKCGQCEMVCPQHLKITELLEEVKSVFE